MSQANLPLSNVAAETPLQADRLAHNASWLLRLRWVAVAGQLVTVSVVHFALESRLPLAPLLTIISLTAVTNLAFWAYLVRSQREGEAARPAKLSVRLIFAIMVVDLLALTGLLYFTGGPANPFTIFFFVNLSLSAVMLPPRYSWRLAAVALACVTLLFYFHRPMSALAPVSPRPPKSSITLPLAWQGQWVSLTACAAVIVYFITRIASELRRREAELRAAQQRRVQAEHLQALTTMAAGAGHELATPLSTIAVVAGELSRNLQGANVSPSVLEDVALIRNELDHCRAILDRMTGQAGQAAGEQLHPVRMSDVVEEALSGLRHPERIQLEMPPSIAACQVVAPLQGLGLAIRGVLQNAVDASPESEPVRLSVSTTESEVIVQVSDGGPGMSSETLARAKDPFFTTKEPGRGMGLGLFLTRGVIDRLGGEFQMASAVGRGTTVSIRLPLN